MRSETFSLLLCVGATSRQMPLRVLCVDTGEEVYFSESSYLGIVAKKEDV